MEIEVQDLIENWDLSLQSPPYFQQSFQKWRKQLLVKYRDRQDFIEIIDHVYLPQFKQKVQEAYYTSFYNYALVCNELGVDQELIQQLRDANNIFDLVDTISRWCTELEIALDLFQRAKLYRFYTELSEQKIIYKDLKQQWNQQTEPLLYKMYKFMLRFFQYSAGKTTQAIQFTKPDLATSRAMIMSNLIQTYLSGQVPWPILAFMGTQLSWILTAWFTTQLHLSRQQYEIDSCVNQLNQQLYQLLWDLENRNKLTLELIDKCSIQRNIYQRQLQHHLNSVLSHQPEEATYTMLCDIEEEEWIFL